MDRSEMDCDPQANHPIVCLERHGRFTLKKVIWPDAFDKLLPEVKARPRIMRQMEGFDGTHIWKVCLDDDVCVAFFSNFNVAVEYAEQNRDTEYIG